MMQPVRVRYAALFKTVPYGAVFLCGKRADAFDISAGRAPNTEGVTNQFVKNMEDGQLVYNGMLAFCVAMRYNICSCWAKAEQPAGKAGLAYKAFLTAALHQRAMFKILTFP